MTDADSMGVPVSLCETIGVHGRRFNAYQIDPRYPTHVVYEKPVAEQMARVIAAARELHLDPDSEAAWIEFAATLDAMTAPTPEVD